jgi:hypothetical protein
MPECLNALAAVGAADGTLERAARFSGAADTLPDATVVAPPQVAGVVNARWVARLHATLPESDFAAA